MTTLAIVYLFQYFDPLPALITKEKITDEELFQCKKVIYNLISLESKMEPLHPLNTGQRMKGQKREEQYKAMWNELETLVKNNLHTDNHRSVYTCLLECHKFNFEEDKIAEKVELDEALNQLDNIGMTSVVIAFIRFIVRVLIITMRLRIKLVWERGLNIITLQCLCNKVVELPFFNRICCN